LLREALILPLNFGILILENCCIPSLDIRIKLLLWPLILIKAYALLVQWIKQPNFGICKQARSILLLKVMKDKSYLLTSTLTVIRY